ncbi:MAG: hypothetical protein LUH58_06085 [Lachnospiraceae bacterium]|nr:hypothetical protein [Lachnospiraceae bacterium]
MDKKLRTVVWLLYAALLQVILFCTTKALSPTFWITYIFIWVACLSVLFVKRMSIEQEKYLRISFIVLEVIYLLIQIPIGVVFSLGANVISYKTAILVNVLILVVFWILMAGSLYGSSHIQNVEGRQENHQTKL